MIRSGSSRIRFLSSLSQENRSVMIIENPALFMNIKLLPFGQIGISQRNSKISVRVWNTSRGVTDLVSFSQTYANESRSCVVYSMQSHTS
jgi:hypothetical protein